MLLKGCKRMRKEVPGLRMPRTPAIIPDSPFPRFITADAGLVTDAAPAFAEAAGRGESSGDVQSVSSEKTGFLTCWAGSFRLLRVILWRRP